MGGQESVSVCVLVSSSGLGIGGLNMSSFGTIGHKIAPAVAAHTCGAILQIAITPATAGATNPFGSVRLTGLLPTYAYVFNPPTSPIGSDSRYLPVDGSYVLK